VFFANVRDKREYFQGRSSTLLRKWMRSGYPIPKRMVIMVFAGVSRVLPSITIDKVGSGREI